VSPSSADSSSSPTGLLGQSELGGSEEMFVGLAVSPDLQSIAVYSYRGTVLLVDLDEYFTHVNSRRRRTTLSSTSSRLSQSSGLSLDVEHNIYVFEYGSRGGHRELPGGRQSFGGGAGGISAVQRSVSSGRASLPVGADAARARSAFSAAPFGAGASSGSGVPMSESESIAQRIAQYGILAAAAATSGDPRSQGSGNREQLHWHERLQGASGSRMNRGWLTQSNANYAINGFNVRNETKMRSNPVGYVT